MVSLRSGLQILRCFPTGFSVVLTISYVRLCLEEIPVALPCGSTLAFEARAARKVPFCEQEMGAHQFVGSV